MSVNKAILIGRLGRDPEIRFTPAGKAVATFDIATDSVWKDRDGNRQKDTQWHKIVVWGPQGETAAKHLSKGREVFIEGEIKTRNYTDKEGVKRYITEIIARDVRFLGAKPEGSGEGDDPRSSGGGGQGQTKLGDWPPEQPADEDIPF